MPADMHCRMLAPRRRVRTFASIAAASAVTLAVLAAVSLAAAQQSATGAAPAADGTVLVLGPLPLRAPSFAGAKGAARADFVPELDPHASWPREGDPVAWLPGVEEAWQARPLAEGRVVVGAAGAARAVVFVLAYVDAAAFGDVQIGATAPKSASVRVFADGAELSALPATRAFARGRHRILVRVEMDAADEADVELVCTPAAGQALAFGADPAHAPAAYDAFRDVVTLSGLKLSPDGRFLAVRRTERAPAGDQATSRLDVLDADSGRVVAAALLGDGASAVEWTNDGAALLVRVKDDLWLWRAADRALERLLDDEPGLGAVACAPDASFVVFASERGAPGEPAKDAPRRRVDLREKLADWPVRPHLHLLMRANGARHRLAVPGDWAQDPFAVLPDGRTLLSMRSVPLAERPWFATEFRLHDLGAAAAGEANEGRLVATLAKGFENRPGLLGMAASPDGTKVAFTGPPAELGVAGREPNAFDPRLFVLDLGDGSWSEVTEGLALSVNGDLCWSANGAALFFHATQGSRSVLCAAAAAPAEPGGFDVRVRPAPGEVIHAASIAPTGRVAAVASDAARFPWLAVVDDVRASEHGYFPTLDPNQELARRLRLIAPQERSFTASDGTPIEAWLYDPAAPGAGADAGAAEKRPFLVYFYGGASPTLRGFNELHQFLVANGWPLYVVNPRGANGYGRAFADAHVADWGPRSGNDILEGVADLLAREPSLDPSRIGCYGGSYGGFMTMWLLANSDRFAAGVSLYGISDVASFFGEGMWGWTYGDQALANVRPWSTPDWFVAHSPIYHADRITAPLLLLHGEADGNVPIGESEQMFNAMKLLGRDVELVRFPGEDHGLRGTWTNRVLHRTMLHEWFDARLRGAPAAWKARWAK